MSRAGIAFVPQAHARQHFFHHLDIPGPSPPLGSPFHVFRNDNTSEAKYCLFRRPSLPKSPSVLNSNIGLPESSLGHKITLLKSVDATREC